MKQGLKNASASLIAILAGLASGFVILLISKPDSALAGLAVILKGGFNNGLKGVGQVLYLATPLIMTGLSVGFAFRTGLFNIGAAGDGGGRVRPRLGRLYLDILAGQPALGGRASHGHAGGAYGGWCPACHGA